MVTKAQVEAVAKLMNEKGFGKIKTVAVKEEDLKEAFMSAVDAVLDRIDKGEEIEVPPKAAEVYNALVEEDEAKDSAPPVEEEASEPEPVPEVKKLAPKKAAAKKPEVKKEAPKKVAPKKSAPEKKAPVKKEVAKKVAPVKKEAPKKPAPKKGVVKKVADSSIGIFTVRKGTNAEKQLALLMKAPIKMKDMEAKTGRTCYSLIHQMEARGMKLTVTEDKKYFLSAK